MDRMVPVTRDDGAMREYGQYCPVALGSEVLAERWTPLILREMVLGSTRFNEIERGLPGISRSLLLKRLKQLERRGVVEIVEAPGGRGHEYHLTPAGRDLEEVIMTLGEWTVRWLFKEPLPARGRPDHVDVVDAPPGRHRGTPDSRVVVQFDYRDAKPHDDLAGARSRRAVGVHEPPRLRHRRPRHD